MLKKAITFTDYNGKSQTETFYFHLNEAELTELELSEDGGLVKTIERITSEENHKEIVRIFKALILEAIGIKSDDGRRFIKSDTIKLEFEQSPAYPKLFMELATDADKATGFVNGVLPMSLTQKSKPPQQPKP